MKILILEDEIYAYRMLRQMLLELDAGNEVLGPVGTVESSRAYLQHHPDVDLIIADIQLNDGLSFEALDEAPDTIPVIFTTAYDEHALRAFEYNSLSYLLKPIDEAELAQAIRKARRLTVMPSVNGAGLRTAHTLAGQVMKGTPYRERFVAKTFRGIRPIHVADVRYIVSEHKTTYLCLHDGRSYDVDMPLGEIAGQLNPKLFMRVNRKYIVPASQVKSLEHIENGKGLLLLKGDNVPAIVVSREHRAEVRRWLDGQ